MARSIDSLCKVIIVDYFNANRGWELILKKVKNKSIFDKSQKSKEKVDFDDTLKK